MKKSFPILFTGLSFVICVGSGMGQAQLSLDHVLSQMVKSGQDFRTLEARIERDNVTYIVDDHAISSGTFYFSALGNDSKIRMNLLEPAGQELLVAGGRAQLYSPRSNQMQEYDFGGQGTLSEFLVVGFGPANASLQDNFEVTLVEEEDLEGIATSVIDLTPRSEEVLRNFRNIRLWVDQTRWIPVQQRLDQRGSNYQLVKYSEIQINKELSDSVFQLDLPDDVQIVR